MKTGKTLVELATELDRQRKVKKDFIVDTRELGVAIPIPEADGPDLGPAFIVPGHGDFVLNKHTHGQVATHTGIPQRYYDRMLAESPTLWQENVQHWFGANPKRRMVRTLDDGARAFLSDSYRPLDNEELMQAAMPALISRGVEVRSSEVTDTRLYIKFIDPELKGIVAHDAPGEHKIRHFDGPDEFLWGGVLQNSEVGAGSLTLSTFCIRTFCMNGLIVEQKMRQVHIGGTAGANDGVYFRDDTRAANDKALFLQIRDSVEGLLTQAEVDKAAAKFSETTTRALPNPIKAVEVLSKNHGFTEDEQNDVLTNLIKAGDLTQWGLANAVTRAAEDRPEYDRATEFEGLGMRVIELTPNQWREVAVA